MNEATSPCKYALGQKVQLLYGRPTDTPGEIIGRTEFLRDEPKYLVRYNHRGLPEETWLRESSIEDWAEESIESLEVK